MSGSDWKEGGGCLPSDDVTDETKSAGNKGATSCRSRPYWGRAGRGEDFVEHPPAHVIAPLWGGRAPQPPATAGNRPLAVPGLAGPFSRSLLCRWNNKCVPAKVPTLAGL